MRVVSTLAILETFSGESVVGRDVKASAAFGYYIDKTILIKSILLINYAWLKRNPHYVNLSNQMVKKTKILQFFAKIVCLAGKLAIMVRLFASSLT
jgi:hypothetical protein